MMVSEVCVASLLTDGYVASNALIRTINSMFCCPLLALLSLLLYAADFRTLHRRRSGGQSCDARWSMSLNLGRCCYFFVQKEIVGLNCTFVGVYTA
jgi:hypothetical protein